MAHAPCAIWVPQLERAAPGRLPIRREIVEDGHTTLEMPPAVPIEVRVKRKVAARKGQREPCAAEVRVGDDAGYARQRLQEVEKSHRAKLVQEVPHRKRHAVEPGSLQLVQPALLVVFAMDPTRMLWAWKRRGEPARRSVPEKPVDDRVRVRPRRRIGRPSLQRESPERCSIEEEAIDERILREHRARHSTATELRPRAYLLRPAELSYPTPVLTRALSSTARQLWPLIQRLNRAIERPSLSPSWAPGPMPKRRERTSPPLGFPRETDSLCPRCVKEVRTDVLSGKTDLRTLIDGRPGEIKAQIVEEERDGHKQVLMKKTCPKHGDFEDVMALDSAFLERIEQLYPGRDYLAPLTKLREHGTSSIKYGRGSVLTVDLTNRCNMMCDPCFMDANQVGYVHELEWADIQKILDDALTVQPRRQMSIQFSGGEPTLSPHFLTAIEYARKVGFFAVQCATNGIRFAQEPSFAKAAKEAGMRMAYLQFDGVGNEVNAHRKVGNLFDVKVRAIENLHAAGIDVILVVTVVNGVNNHEVGRIVDFAIENADKVTVVSFQPVSFTGRDEDISDEMRAKQRYTLSHLAQDLKDQCGFSEPLRDWFPLSSMGPFSDLTDHLLGERADWGSMKCGCHPNCGIGTILFVNKATKQAVPLTKFLDIEGLLEDIQDITDAAQGRTLTLTELAISLLKNFNAKESPVSFPTLVRQFLSQTGARGKKVGEHESDANEFEWRVLFIAGMWFQDLFNYDFRRTEMCIIPYGTQMGEISFCAYNTGVGWRQVIEKMKQTASVAEWNRVHGRHPVYAKNQNLSLSPDLGTVTLPKERVRLPVVTG